MASVSYLLLLLFFGDGSKVSTTEIDVSTGTSILCSTSRGVSFGRGFLRGGISSFGTILGISDVYVARSQRCDHCPVAPVPS